MSLYFLIMTAVTFYICHWTARNTIPGENYIYQKEFLFNGEKKNLIFNINSWVKNNSSLLFIHENKMEFVIQKNSSLFSFGYFYHIKITPTEVDSQYKVQFKVEAKLISTAKEQRFFSKSLLKQLELKEEGIEDEAA